MHGHSSAPKPSEVAGQWSCPPPPKADKAQPKSPCQPGNLLRLHNDDEEEKVPRHNGGTRVRRAARDDYLYLETHPLGRKLRLPIALPLRISVLDCDVLSVYVGKLAQSEPNCLETGGFSSWIDRRQIPYPRDFLRLLRLGLEAKSDEPSRIEQTEFPLIHFSLTHRARLCLFCA
jgi:hypothetical protein